MGASGRQFSVSFVIGLQDKLGAPLSRLQKQLKASLKSTWRWAVRIERYAAQAARAVARHLRALALAFAGTAASSAAAAVAVTREWAQFSQLMAQTAAMIGGVGEEFEQNRKALEKFGRALSRTTSKTADQVADTVYALSAAGLSLNEMMSATPGIVALAEGAMYDLGATSELVVSVMRGFGLEASETNRIVNVLQAASAATMMSMARMGLAMPYVTAVAHAMGMQVEETAAALGVLVDNGLAASSAGAGLRMVLSQLARSGGANAKILAKYGLTMADVSIQTHGFQRVLERLARAGLSYADTAALMGERGATVATILMTQAAKVAEVTQSVTGTNFAFIAQRQQLDTLMGRWALFRNRIADVRKGLGERLEPAMAAVVRRFDAWAAQLERSGLLERWADAVAGAVRRALAWTEGGGFTRALALAQQGLDGLRRAWADVAARMGPGLARLSAAWQEFGRGMWEWLAEGGQVPVAQLRAVFARLLEAARVGLVTLAAEVDRALAAAFGAERWAAIKGHAAEVGTAWAEALLPILRAAAAVAPVIAGIAQWFARLVAERPRLAVWGTSVVAVLARLGSAALSVARVWPQLAGAFSRVGAALGRVVPALASAGGWLARLGPLLATVGRSIAALATGPVGVAVSAFVALGLAIRTALAAWGAWQARRQATQSERDLAELQERYRQRSAPAQWAAYQRAVGMAPEARAQEQRWEVPPRATARAEAPEVRVYIGETELRQLARQESGRTLRAAFTPG